MSDSDSVSRPDPGTGDPGTGTVLGLLRAAEGYLVERRVEAPRLSIEWMLGKVLGLSRMQVYLSYDRPIAEAERQELRQMVARRGRGEPLAYILGDQDFCGHTFRVTPAVLIPRPESEFLVTRLAETLPEGARGADIGTGSGAIAIALCLARPDVSLVATDVSADALAVARENAARLGVEDRVEFREGSFWQPLAGEQLQFLSSNPPYVDPQLPELLAEDVRRFEPDLALFAPPGDPGAVYRSLVAGMRDGLVSGAAICIETGVGADAAAEAALREVEFLDGVELIEDEAGLPRYLVAVRV